MSSPDPPHLRLSLPSTASTFKRSFDQFGFDLEPPLDSSLAASTSSTDEHRPGPSNTDRNKRARSNSVTPNNSHSAEQARSIDTSSSSSSHSTSSTASNHMTTTHRDAPLPPPPTARHSRAPRNDSNDSMFSPGLSLGEEPTHTPTLLFESRSSDTSINPPASTTWSNPPSSANPTAEHNEQFRLSMERFHAFDSQISSIRARPSPLPHRSPPNPPTLPPLTLSSNIEHPHTHLNSAVSLPSVESFAYTVSSAQSAAAPPPPAQPPIASSTIDHYPSDISPLAFEEFGEFREMMGYFPEQNSNSRSVDRSVVRPRQSSSPLENSGRHRVDQPFRRSPSRQIAEEIPRNSTLRPWPVAMEHRGAIFGDSDDEFGDLPVVNSLQSRRPSEVPRSRLDHSLLANRIRRSMRDQASHEVLGRMSPPRFPTPTTSQIESNQTRSNSRIQEHERPDRYEHRSLYPPSRRPVLPEAVRTLAERLGRGRQRTDYTAEGGTERSRSPAPATFSNRYPLPPFVDSTSAYDDWLFDLPEFASSESPYALDLPTPSSWIDEDSTPSRLPVPSSRIQRDALISRPAPRRSPLPPNDIAEDRILTYLTLMHRVPSTVPSGEETQPDLVWRRLSSFSDYHPPHLQSTRTSSGHGNGANNTPLTRATHSAESSSATTSQDVSMGWLRSLARAELNHERDTSSAPMASSSFGDRPLAERTSASIRGLIDRRPHLQPPSRIPLDPGTRRPSEVYRPVQAMEATNDVTVDTDSIGPDESSEVPFSSHAAALFASRGTSAVEPTSLRRPDFVDLDRLSPLPHPRGSRVEGDFAISAPRRRADVGGRRYRTSPEPERLSTTRRHTTTEPPASFVPGSRPLDIEEFQHGPFRATLERLERRELQEHQIVMERQAEIDRLRSRLDELQSLDRPSSSRIPTLPPLRFDREPLASEALHRMPSSTPPTNIDSSPFRTDPDVAHRRRSWNRARGSRPWLHPSDEPAPWRSPSSRPPPSAPVPMPRAHSPPRPLPEGLDPHPPRPRPETLELMSFGDVDEYSFDNLMAAPPMGGSIFARNLTRMRGEPPSVDVQQSRREPRGSSPGNLDPGVRPASREPHADALRGIRPLWATHVLGPWGPEVRDEMLATSLSAGTSTDTTVRGRRRRVNQSTLPSQGRNGSEDERPPAGRRASSTSRYAATRRTIRDPLLERVQRMVRGSSRESGFFGRYGRRNPGDFMRDEDFDTSYESLLSLAATIGEVRPRHTPDHVIELLPTAMFKEWCNAESDHRCPICLDDYQEDDRVMKLSDCSHWLHKSCLQQWLRGATTCPVCRQRVGGPQPGRREREARAVPSSGSSRGLELRSEIDINREIQEHVRMAFPNIAAAVRAEAGPSSGGSDAERDVEQEDGDVVDMTLDWGIENAI